MTDDRPRRDNLPCLGIHCGDGRDCPAGEGASEEDCQNAWAELNDECDADLMADGPTLADAPEGDR